MKKSEDLDPASIAAISAAIELYYGYETAEEIQPPPYIILPSVLAAQPSFWRYVGRNESMNNRTMVQMKSMRW
jgi:hypothetical protein